MLPKSLIRLHVKAQFPTLDKYALTAITDKIHKWAYSEADLASYAVRGAVEAHLRHTATSYEEDLRSHASHYFDGARKHFQETARKQLTLRYGI